MAKAKKAIKARKAAARGNSKRLFAGKARARAHGTQAGGVFRQPIEMLQKGFGSVMDYFK